MKIKFSFILLSVVGLTLLFSNFLSVWISGIVSLILGLASALFLAKGTKKSLENMETPLRSLLQNLEEKVNQLQSKKEEISTILNSMVEHVITIDEEGTVLYINQAAENLLGITSTDVMGKHFLEIVRHASLTDLLKKVLREKVEHALEIELHLPERHTFDVRAVPLPRKGKKGGVLVVLHDTTRIHTLEIVRKDFIANVSHELRTPLTTIRGTAETLLSGAIADTKHNREFLEMMLNESERLSRLVDTLLDLSALESSKVAPKKTSFSLKTLLAEVLKSVSALEKEYEVTCESNLLADLPEITADRDQMKQVFINLMDNAIKFNRKGGTVMIAAQRKEGAIVISIEDTGIGIPALEIPRIFERFYRVDKDRSRKLGGTGLGLAIVKHIVNLHNGSIQVISAPNEGSTFSVNLPI